MSIICFGRNFINWSPLSGPTKTPKLPCRNRAETPSKRLFPYPFALRRLASPCRFSGAEMEIPREASPAPATVKLKPIEATAESFEPYGQVVEASPDGDEFGPRDAQLDLSRGIPRFYIMHIEDRPMKFRNITHHASVTQCLGSIGGHSWYLGVAKPSILDTDEQREDGSGSNIAKSRCGHFYAPPRAEDVRVFKVTGPKFLKLNRGTWHAGPIFKEKAMDFYNLELSDTNVVDHTTHDFTKENGVTFLIDD